VLDLEDLQVIVSTHKENEMRFKRDYFGKQFSDVLPFRGAKESTFIQESYRVVLGANDFTNDFDCAVSPPKEIPPLQTGIMGTPFTSKAS
jgi:hypothetical protein